MTTWRGWEADLLKALKAKDTPGNRAFLTGWERRDGTTCKDNPLTATVPLAGSSHCKHVSGSTYVQSYTSRANGIAATVNQLAKADYAPIVAALASGDPITYADWQHVVGALGVWGAHRFAVQYGTAARRAQAPVATGGSIASDASRSLAGYKHFANQLVHTVPTQLRHSQRLRASALAKLRGKA